MEQKRVDGTKKSLESRVLGLGLYVRIVGRTNELMTVFLLFSFSLFLFPRVLLTCFQRERLGLGFYIICKCMYTVIYADDQDDRKLS